MIEPVQKYFKLGIVAAASYDAMYAQNPAAAARAIVNDPYFEVIELNPVGDAKVREEIVNCLSQSHMEVSYGAQGKLLSKGLSLADMDEGRRLSAVEAVCEGIKEAELMGAKRAACLAGKWQADALEQSYRQLVRSMEQLCAYGAAKGISLELEVFDYDMDKASLIGPAPLAARLAAQLRCKYPNFGLMVDLSHFPTTYEDSRFVIRTLRPYITHLHYGNAVVREGAIAYGDQHPRFGFPNSANDTAQLVEFLSVLKEEGFLDAKDPMILSMEVKPWQGEDMEIVLANTKRVIGRAWAVL